MMRTLFHVWLAYLGLSCRELAGTNRTETAIRNAIRRGHRPEWLFDLADTIGVPIDDLLHRSPTDPRGFSKSPSDQTAFIARFTALEMAAKRRLDAYRKRAPRRVVRRDGKSTAASP